MYSQVGQATKPAVMTTSYAHEPDSWDHILLLSLLISESTILGILHNQAKKFECDGMPMKIDQNI